MVRSGELERVGPGRYRQASADVTENHSLALACWGGAFRSGVPAVRPAVSQHRDTTASRGLAGHSARHACSAPLISTAAAHTGFGAAVNLGIEEHRIEGQRVKVATVARAVADCFRFRNKVGMDVVLEALVEHEEAADMDLEPASLNREGASAIALMRRTSKCCGPRRTPSRISRPGRHRRAVQAPHL